MQSPGWNGPMVSEQEEAVMHIDPKYEPVEYMKVRKAAMVLAIKEEN